MLSWSLQNYARLILYTENAPTLRRNTENGEQTSARQTSFCQPQCLYGLVRSFWKQVFVEMPNVTKLGTRH